MNALRWLSIFGFGSLASLASAQSFQAPAPASSLEAPLTKSAPVAPPSLFGGGTKAPSSLFGSGSSLKQAGSEVLSAEGMTIPSAESSALSTSIMPNGLPGAVYSPWSGSEPSGGCCGPVGLNGPVTYEGYIRTGPAIVSGGGELKSLLKAGGWNVQGGARTLFFNPANDAAWAIDLGVGFTQNDGRGLERTTSLLTAEVRPTDESLGRTSIYGIRRINRTSLNFAFGRDYFLNGPGVVGMQPYSNVRYGWDLGGRYGTSSISLIPQNEPIGARRTQDVYHGFSLGAHMNWEIPFHAWTFVVGGRLEWSYYWMNIIPENDADIRDVNILMMFGVRF